MACLEHVKISDAADVVPGACGPKAAGRSGGTVDLVWISGENFHGRMKRDGLLLGPWARAAAELRPAVDTAQPPTRGWDSLAEPVEGLEAALGAWRS